MTTDENHARLIATAAGLTKLDAKHLAQLAQSVASARELQPLGDRFRPYRSVAAWYCWRAADTLI